MVKESMSVARNQNEVFSKQHMKMANSKVRDAVVMEVFCVLVTVCCMLYVVLYYSC